ncbi:MAG: hypothetical protein U0641_07015 [Anaerolineae bacterium]
MQAPDVDPKEAVIRVLDDLSNEQLAEVLDFALFLKQRAPARGQDKRRAEVKSIPASQLRPLVGIMSVGGDAVEDSERLYDDE